jgi:hypothetical protein
MSIRLVNFRKLYPMASPECWKKWFSVQRYFSGKMIHLNFRGISLVIDRRF